MRIALFDYTVIRTNPVGGLVKRFTDLKSDQRHGLGRRAREAVDGRTVASYVDDWPALYKEIKYGIGRARYWVVSDY
jgi:hypothetical protein